MDGAPNRLHGHPKEGSAPADLPEAHGGPNQKWQRGVKQSRVGGGPGRWPVKNGGAGGEESDSHQRHFQIAEFRDPLFEAEAGRSPDDNSGRDDGFREDVGAKPRGPNLPVTLVSKLVQR